MKVYTMLFLGCFYTLIFIAGESKEAIDLHPIVNMNIFADLFGNVQSSGCIEPIIMILTEQEKTKSLQDEHED